MIATYKWTWTSIIMHEAELTMKKAMTTNFDHKAIQGKPNNLDN